MTHLLRKLSWAGGRLGLVLFIWAFVCQAPAQASTPSPLTKTGLGAALAPLTQPTSAGLLRTGAAGGDERPATTVVFDPIAAVPAGGRAVLVVRLTTRTGEPAVDQHLKLYLNGVIERQSRTNELGVALFSLRRDIPVGRHTFTAVYAGSYSSNLGPSNASTQLEIVPALVAVKIVPPIPNIRVAVADQILASGQNGVAWTTVNHGGLYTAEVLPLETGVSDQQLRFVRWGDSVFLPTRQISVPLRQILEVGLAISYPITMTFVDPQGQPVPYERITSVSIKSTDGGLYTYTEFQSQWFLANWITRRLQGLEATEMMYSVESVIVDGTNVVNATQQRFYSAPNATWQISLLLFSSRFTARDAMFGFPVGAGIRLEYPDDQTRDWPFGPDAKLELHSLARGLYRASVYDVPGFSVITPIALSREQEVALPVITYLDISVALGVGVTVAVGLLIYGRPYLITQLLALCRNLAARRRDLQLGDPP